MSIRSNKGAASQWAILLVIVLIGVAMLMALWPEGKSFEQATNLNELEMWDDIKARFNSDAEKLGDVALDTLEKAQIEAWIIEESLNQFGDLKDTLYTGGTPLFNELTGETMDRFEYLIEKFPEKPWRK